MDIKSKALEFHEGGKLEISSRVKFENQEDLGMIYTPGMAYVSDEIAKDKSLVEKYTMKSNSVAIVSDGTAILGFGNIGPEAGLPVMEGKALVFKKLAGINGFPLCIKSSTPEEVVQFCKMIEPTFGAIQLEDIKAPECFDIEKQLKEVLNIPVLHDDQHGTAVVVLAGIVNALKVTGKKIEDCKIIVNGSGAAGIAISKILVDYGATNLTVFDSKSAVSKSRQDLNKYKQELLEITNPNNYEGGLKENLKDADIFIGVSVANLLDAEDIQNMNEKAIVFALANPVPEIGYNEAKEAGAAVVATGRADYPNQVNNVLAFPGLFKGILEAGKKVFLQEDLIKAAENLAGFIEEPSEDRVIPLAFEEGVTEVVAKAIRES